MKYVSIFIIIITLLYPTLGKAREITNNANTLALENKGSKTPSFTFGAAQAIGAIITVGTKTSDLAAQQYEETGDLSSRKEGGNWIALGFGIAEILLDSGVINILEQNNTNHLSIISLIIAFSTTWIVGLLPIIIIRYSILKSPVSVKKAKLIALINAMTLWVIFNTIIINGGQTGTGAVWILVFYISRKILCVNQQKIK